MNSEFIYQDLLEQYKSLSEKEKYALLIYNSKFYYHINAISRVEDYKNKSAADIFMLLDDNNRFVNNFSFFKKEIMYPQNMVVRHSVFKDINLDDILSFIDSIKDICETLDEARTKIKLCADMEVYRGISLMEGTFVNGVSNSKFISTSINIDDANDFIYQKGSYESHLFVISLKKGTNVLVTPLTLVWDYKDAISMLRKDSTNATLKVANRRKDGQKEIILFDDDLNFKELSVQELDVDEESNLIIHKVKALSNLEISNDKKINM